MYRFMILCMASMGELEKAMSLRAMIFVILGSSVICTTRFHRSTRQFVQSEGIPYLRFAPYGMTRGMECPAELSTCLVWKRFQEKVRTIQFLPVAYV